MIKLAFIKFGGMAASGTEKFLQQIAANLNKQEFEVDYFYCDAAPYIGSDWKHPDTDQTRVQYMKDKGINLVKFNVGFKDVTVNTHDWVNTNFWEVFDESKYDIVVTGRAGHPEYPFYKIRKIPIVDTIHLSGMVDNQDNIARVIHISEWNRNDWVSKGGDGSRTEVLYPPMELPKNLYEIQNLRQEFGLGKYSFVFGMHQRRDDGIFSPIPLEAFSKLNNKDCVYVLLGASELYRKQAQELGLGDRFIALDFSGDSQYVFRFLKTLDVYAHGRKDGEINSQAIAEALGCGLPVVSHYAQNNGHVECVGEAGTICRTVDEYTDALSKHFNMRPWHLEMRQKAKNRFDSCYLLENQIKKYENLFKDISQQFKSNSFQYQKKRQQDSYLLDWLAQ